MTGATIPPVILLTVVLGALGLGTTVFWIWVLIDCATKEPSDRNDKLVWALIILFTHCVGALIYFLVRRPQRQQTYGT